MKKLILILLTTAAAATAVTGFTACTNGHTGTDTANAQTGRTADVTQDEQLTENEEYEFMPPRMPMGGEATPLPFPPQGRIFNHIGNDPELMPKILYGGIKEGAPADESMPQSKIMRKRNKKKDQQTPEGANDGKNAQQPNNCPDCPNTSGEEAKQSAESSQTKRGKKRKQDKRTKEKDVDKN